MIPEFASHETTQLRLGHIEDQLTRVSDAVVSIARMDERLVAVLEGMERFNLKIESESQVRRLLESRVHDLEKEGVSTNLIKQFLTIVITGAITAVIGGIGYVVVG